MNPIAVTQAKEKLERAKSAIIKLQHSKTFAERSASWADFLVASSGVYSKLEQGSKSNGKSTAWFGRKKHDRKKNPLLSYIHHARNTEEHGIAPTTERKNGSLTISGDFSLKGDIGSGGTLNITPLPDGRFPVVEIEKPTIILVGVTDDRFGDSFDPPNEHLGTPLSNNSPLTVANLAIAYLSILIEEASKLAK